MRAAGWMSCTIVADGGVSALVFFFEVSRGICVCLFCQIWCVDVTVQPW